MWPHGWRRGKPVESTIFWILTRMHIRYPLCPENDALSQLACARGAEASQLRASFSGHNGYFMYIHGLPKGPHTTTFIM